MMCTEDHANVDHLSACCIGDCFTSFWSWKSVTIITENNVAFIAIKGTKQRFDAYTDPNKYKVYMNNKYNMKTKRSKSIWEHKNGLK